MKVAITLLEKDECDPKIHRLRPICICETELNCIAKSQWTRKLINHVDRLDLHTDDQYGGKKGQQAQSAVLNKSAMPIYNINYLSQLCLWIKMDVVALIT